jgi:serine/threonine-protein kinase HipA
MSISGVQDKISLRLTDGALLPTETDGEYILKPIPGAPLPRFTDQVPANEHLTMQIAAQVFGIDTAANALLELSDGEPAYLTRRFDRRNGQRLDMEDFASLSEMSSSAHGRHYKYTGSYERIGKLMERYCAAYRVESEKLFLRILFNYAFGNGDAHLKNFSLFTSPDGDHVLTPAYDLVNTHIHLPNESPMALDLFIDYETEAFRSLGFYSQTDFLVLAERLHLVLARAKRALNAFVDTAKSARVDALISASFLSSEAKQAYCDVVADRRRAMGVRSA